jgi:hypothetical protein
MTRPVLTGWRAGPARRMITDFVEWVCGQHGVSVEERVAVLDNEGTLWCEKPMPIQVDFIVHRFAEMANDATGSTGQWSRCRREHSQGGGCGDDRNV